MVIHVGRCDYNVYQKHYALEADVHGDGGKAETYFLTIPANTITTEAEFKAAVETSIARVRRPDTIKDFEGLTWRVDSL